MSEDKAKADSKAQRAPANKPVVETNTSYDPFASLGKSAGELVGTDPGRDYRYTPARDYPPDGVALEDWRNRLAARGFVAENGPRAKGPTAVFHPSEPTAEIWSRPQALADDEWRARHLATNVLRRSFFVHFKNHPTQAPRMSERLRRAMFAYHGQSDRRGDGRPTKEEILALCREEPVHPGEPQESWQR